MGLGGGGMRWTTASRISSIPMPILALAVDRFLGRNGENFLELPMNRGHVGIGQIDLVDHRHDREALFVREVDVGDRLRLDALGRIDDEKRAFAGREAARDLVGKIHVARAYRGG